MSGGSVLLSLLWEWHDDHGRTCCGIEGPFCAASLAWAYEEQERRDSGSAGVAVVGR